MKVYALIIFQWCLIAFLVYQLISFVNSYVKHTKKIQAQDALIDELNETIKELNEKNEGQAIELIEKDRINKHLTGQIDFLSNTYINNN